MSNFIGAFRTNYFKVKDIDKFSEFVEHTIGAEVFTGSNDEYISFGEYSDFNDSYYDEDKDEDISVYPTIQNMLDNDQVCVINIIGREKLKYLTAESIIITKDDVDFINHFERTKELITPITIHKENKKFEY